MPRKLRARKVIISGRPDQADLRRPCTDVDVAEVLLFIDDTEVGINLAGDATKDDSWEIKRLDRSADEEDMMLEDGRDQIKR